ncbi:hypothetical protein EAH89_09740 [Roseomonas nepalensis]|uniref:Bacterial Ig domain-containing protein n=1 Tax=Muricoccus nepalensis TaxID=1854500 RepID=A0A502G6V2_9PROT|nr:Ig-like domain-containing protein [Roseomonas nepalensis]TPG57705.1 hypothetical protein EAH89_09740 [Roseomonas nepalensis]
MAYVIDGVLNEWSALDRLDRPGSVPIGYQLFGRVDGNNFVFALQAPVAIGAGTTFWLNTDSNVSTGYKIFGFAGGAEYNVNFFTDGAPYLYTGAAGETFVSGPLQYALSPDKTTAEFVVPFASIGELDRKVDVLVDVNNTTFLPGDYTRPGFTVSDTASLPQPTDTGLKIGIVYSATTAAKFFDLTAYSQLFMSAQNQAAMAGVPYDILTEADLTNLSKLINYDTLIFPSFQNVRSADVAAIQSTLDTAVYKYGVGLVTAGNFMTNDETGASLPGNAYSRMETLLGVTRSSGGSGVNVDVRAADTSHPTMAGYAPGEEIRTYTGIGTQVFSDLTGKASVLATQSINGGAAQNAVLATQTGGRNVHFATEGMMADNNMLEDALGWSARNTPGPKIELHMSRQSAIFASRNDLDEAMYPDEVKPDTGLGIYDKLLSVLDRWKVDYNFVGSYYIDIGNGANGTGTDWNVSRPYYKRLLDAGNEIGSHSITHPENTNLLTAAQLQTEFEGSRNTIQTQLRQIPGYENYVVSGAAIPGAPEKIGVSQEVLKYYSYLSGGNAQIGAGYPGAFGYLTPSDTKVYIAPNISSDFTLVGFKGMTPTQATAAWQAEWQAMTAHADLPVVVFPWHGYGITGFEPGYTVDMFESLIRTASQAGSEFVTLDDLQGRISSFEKSNLEYSMVDGDTVSVKVNSTGKLGTFALDLSGTDRIKNVAGWYAYDANSIFLPATGGTFTFDLGSTPDDVTHITSLPSRAQLLSATSPGGGGLDFSIIGDGKVVIDLENPAGRYVVVTGATVLSQVGDQLELGLTGLGQHAVSVRLSTTPPPPPPPPAPASVTNVVSNATTATISGIAAAASKVQVLDGTTLLGTVTADGTGAWSLQTTPLTDIVHTLTARTVDASGNTGTASNVGLFGSTNADSLVGGTGNDALFGNAGADTLDGGAGNDTMNGGGGNDLYVVDSAGDVITDSAGTDTVRSSITYTLAAALENLVLTGTAALNGTGNAAANAITGNDGANLLTGLDGNDTLTGGLGADTLDGGLGDDRYVLDSAADVIIDAGGIDTVEAGFTYVLGTGIENLVLTGTAAINGTGNAAANAITGNSGANALFGLAGNDTLTGGAGNDTLDGGTGDDSMNGGGGDDRYIVDSLGDIIVDSGGIDTVEASLTYTLGSALENLVLTGALAINGTGNGSANTLTGNDAANYLSGLAGADTLIGGGGNDTLLGGAGADRLTGGTGADTFLFLRSNEGTDTITDFDPLADFITVSASGFGGFLSAGMNVGASGRFTANTSGLSNALPGIGQFVYETDIGRLWWDPDGIGLLARVSIATLTGNPALTASDITIIA